MLSRLPNIEKTFNLREFTLWMTQENSLHQAIKDFNGVTMHFTAWRVLLGLSKSPSDVQSQRHNYQVLVAKYQRNEDIVTKQPLKKDPLSRNPLSGAVSNHQENSELKNMIKLDVTRTYQEIKFFDNQLIKNLLVNVLFIWSKNNPSISYIQGMNEVAASLVYVYYKECLGQDSVELVDDSEIGQLAYLYNDVQYAEADIYSMFERIMNDGQHMEMFRPNYTAREKQKQQLGSKKPSPILNRIAKLQDLQLKTVDLDLFRHIKLLEVELRVFLLRWFRCIFTREFTLHESFQLWDSVILEYSLEPQHNTFNMIDYIALAMMSFVRQQVLEQDESSQVYQKFLKYPKIQELKTLVEAAFIYKEILKNPEAAQNYNSKLQQIFGKAPVVYSVEEPKKAPPPLQKQPISQTQQSQNQNPFFVKQEPLKPAPVSNAPISPMVEKVKKQNKNDHDNNNKPPAVVIKSEPKPEQNEQFKQNDQSKQVVKNENTQIKLNREDVQIIISALSEGIDQLKQVNMDQLIQTQSYMEEIKMMLEREMSKQS